MQSIDIKLGDKVTISTKDGYRSQHPYPSRVADILDKNLFLVNAPLFRGKVVALRLDKEYIFMFYTEEGLYQAKGTIEEYCFENNAALMKIKVDDFERVQRRRFFRVNAVMDFTYLRMKDAGESESVSNIPVYKGVIENLSGGGLCFVTDELLTASENILCSLMLNNAFVTVEGKVLSVEQLESHNDIFEYRVELINIEEQQQERIVKYVLEKELELIRKKKLAEENND